MGGRTGRPRKYDWGRWLTQRTVLVRGVDYRLAQSAMVQQIRTNASMRGLRVRVLDADDRIIIEPVGRVHDTPRLAPYRREGLVVSE